MKHKFSSMGRVAIALVLALSLSLVMAVPVSAQLSPVTAEPVNTTENAETTYTIGFTTPVPSTIKQVVMQFFTDLDVDSAVLGAVSGIGPGSVSIEGQFVTYTVTEAVSIPASTITIALSGIVNPVAGTYASPVTVTTKDPALTVIDQGTAGSITITPLPASFKVEKSGEGVITTAAGATFDVRVTAMDEPDGGGTKVDGYVGEILISFTSTASDPKTIPFWELINFSDGVGETSSSNFILTKVETLKTITAEDTALGVTGTSAAITITPAALDSLTITGAPASVTAGVAFPTNITVTAYDAYGNVMTTDSSTAISWTTTASAHLLPANKNLALGTCTFLKADFNLETAGAQTITATGGSKSKTSDPITVNPAAASKMTVAAAPSTITADGSHSSTITATAYDEFDNVDTNYTESVTFATSLGTLSDVSTNFVAGVATATLTSTDKGTATIKVTSGTLADVTTIVALVAPDKPEVWVDDDAADDSGEGTLADPFRTIAYGIEEVDLGGTVNVLAGTYEGVLDINKALTLSGANAGVNPVTETRVAESIIDATSNADAVMITTDEAVTFQGFTVTGWTKNGVYQSFGASAFGLAKILDNIVIGPADSEAVQNSIAVWGDNSEVKRNKVEGAINTLEDTEAAGIMVIDGDNVVIEDNWVYSADTAIAVLGYNAAGLGNTPSGTQILHNTVKDSVRGIRVDAVAAVANTTIKYNVVDGNEIGIESCTDGTVPSGTVANYNNIVNNGIGVQSVLGELGTSGDPLEIVDATLNWWGTAIESDIEAIVSGDVNYSPWLDAPYPYGEPTTTDSFAIAYSIDLYTGWNLISLPLIPTDDTIETVLADLIDADTVDQVQAYSAGDWLKWATSGPNSVDPTLTVMKDGVGFWLKMKAVDALVATGYELCEPAPAVPPTYAVVPGWNLIGYKFTDAGNIQSYLGTVIYTDLQAIYGYKASTGNYFIPDPYDGLEPGYGYFIALTNEGTIYPTWATPGG